MQEVANHVQAMWHSMVQGQLQGIWFWGAAYFVLMGGLSLVVQWRTRRWPCTAGILAQSGLERWGGPAWSRSDQAYLANARYRYQVAGQVYPGHRVSPWVFVASHNARFVLDRQLKGIQKNPDGSVKVFYNPGRPHKSFLILPGIPGMGVSAALAVGPFLLYGVRFHGA
jgi:hypothetical protein